MARAQINQMANVIGSFNEKEHGNVFEYGENDTGWLEDLYPHVVYVGTIGETRVARVIKSRAFVVVDQDAGGCPVEECWLIKNHREW